VDHVGKVDADGESASVELGGLDQFVNEVLTLCDPGREFGAVLGAPGLGTSLIEELPIVQNSRVGVRQ